jgi:hypothetical protein
MSKTKKAVIGSSIGFIAVNALTIWGLYTLGGADQSPLERFRDISLVLVVLLLLVITILQGVTVAALVFLVIQIKDKVIPMLEELTATATRLKGTADFVTEEAVRPIIQVASGYARIRAMAKTFVEKPKKP